jgi:hypothetical protein
MEIYPHIRNIITSADTEPQENINAFGVAANLAVSIVKI